MCIFHPRAPCPPPIFHPARFLLLCEKTRPRQTGLRRVLSTKVWAECQDEHESWRMCACMCVCLCVVNAPPVSLCMSSRECATTAVTVRLFCCKVNVELHPPLHPPSLAFSKHCRSCCQWQEGVSCCCCCCWPGTTAGVRDTGQHAHTGTDWHSCAHSCVRGRCCSLARTQIRNACTQTTPPALEKKKVYQRGTWVVRIAVPAPGIIIQLRGNTVSLYLENPEEPPANWGAVQKSHVSIYRPLE